MKLNIIMLTKRFNNQFYKPLYLVLVFILLCSHNLYIKMEPYFLKPHQKATLSLYNGTFEESENLITRDRMLDASFIFQGKRYPIDSTQWIDKDNTITQFLFTPMEAGTYMAGVSTKARNIKLPAEKFNNYLEHDGVLDMLEQRKKEKSLDQDAVESYEKHVKAIYQVGDEKTDDWSMVLGYPIEFVPLANPYEKYTHGTLEVQLLMDGKPLANQLVYVDCAEVSHDHDHGHNHDHGHSHDDKKHSHKHDEDGHSHTSGQQLRTNNQGIITLEFPEDGVYYLRTIHMTKVTDSEEITHRSKWATLTFGVQHKDGQHDHNHDDDEGIPMWVFILVSVLLIVILFFVFRKKSS